MDTLAKLIATFFGIGYCPIWPGALGSAAGIGLAWLIPQQGLLPAFVLTTVVGFWACSPAVRIFGRKDPQTFVMDEVSGMLLSVLFLPKTLPVYVAGYILFRIFDACKPWPISIIQKNDHPWAIVWDDLAAGLAANIVLQVAVPFLLSPGGFLN